MLFLHSRFNKTHRRLHTQEMWATHADLSNTYSEKTLLISFILMMRSAAGKKKHQNHEILHRCEVGLFWRWRQSELTLSLLSSLKQKWSKGWRARVLSGHAVRGKSARELLWTSLSVLGRSAAADGIMDQISERRALEVKRNLWQMLWDASSFKNNRRGSYMMPRSRIWAHSSLQQSALN